MVRPLLAAKLREVCHPFSYGKDSDSGVGLVSKCRAGRDDTVGRRGGGMSVFVRSTLIFAVALATSASQTVERFRADDRLLLLVGRALITQDGRAPSLKELLVIDVPGTDPRVFPSVRLTGTEWRESADVLIP